MEMDRQDSDASESSGESFGEDDDGSSFSVDTDEDGGAAASAADTGNAAGGEGETSGVAEAAPPTAEDSSREIADLEGELYDIGLAATHSYMSAGMVRVAGRSVHEAGWAGRVPCLAHRAVVFPGEVVPMVLPRRSDVAVLRRVIRTDNLFGLLCPDETGRLISGYGVLCEVFEAGLDDKFEQPVLTFKARATQRFRLTRLNKHSVPINALDRMHYMDIKVLPEYATCESLRNARLSSLAPLHTPPRTPPRTEALRARRLEAAATPWPPFVHDRFDYRRMRKTLQEYFSSIKMYSMPVEPVSLSFWVASNLALMSRDRLALFMVDNALLRLHMECSLITRKSLLCCAACMAVIARKAHIFPMSSEGVHSNFVNLGGYMHDTLTVSRASRVQLQGAPSAEFSWFPGYAWTIATCARCQAHVGWRFEALKSTLRPQHFYGLCRNYIQPCSRRRRPRARSPRSRRSPRLPRAPHSPDSAHSSHSSDLSLF